MEKDREPPMDEKRQTLPPWAPILASHDSFLTDLECIGELIDLVLPLLNARDEERQRRISELIEVVRSENGDNGKREVMRLKSASDLKEFMGHIQKLRQGERIFRQGVITSIVSKFDEFIIDVLRTSFRQNPGWLKNPDKKISYKELLEIKSLDSLKDEIIAKEIDTLMRDSHIAQIEFIDGKLKLGIEKEFPEWLVFLEIAERRNLFVHTGGMVSPQYLQNCEKWKIPVDSNIKEGAHLPAPDKYIKTAIDCFYELSVRVAQASTRRMFPESYAAADKALNNKSVELSEAERWDLAERMFTFALSIPDNLTSGGEMRYFFILNRCVARKFSGKDYQKDLRSIDWRPFHPKYHFAIAILEDRFSDAAKLMKTQTVQDEVPQKYYQEWPLFREFRKSDPFLCAYKEVYGQDFGERLLVDVERAIKAQEGNGSSESPSASPAT